MVNEERPYEKFQEPQAKVGRAISLSEACQMARKIEGRINSAYKRSAESEARVYQVWENEEDD